MQKMISQKAR